ncbi:MAG: hypothetical protein AB7G62_00685 [Magnetospirillum sp.]
MNARIQAQDWLADGEDPAVILPRVINQVLAAGEDQVPLLLRALTYMTEGLMSSAGSAALLRAIADRRFLPVESAACSALRDEVAQLIHSTAAEQDSLAERRGALLQAEERVATLSAELARMNAVLAALPQEVEE